MPPRISETSTATEAAPKVHTPSPKAQDGTAPHRHETWTAIAQALNSGELTDGTDIRSAMINLHGRLSEKRDVARFLTRGISWLRENEGSDSIQAHVITSVRRVLNEIVQTEIDREQAAQSITEQELADMRNRTARETSLRDAYMAYAQAASAPHLSA